MSNISVVIPTFKREQSLAVTLESLREQTCRDFELLVVDNAATPAAENVVKAFARTAPFAVRYLPWPRGGLAGARNNGVANASGNIVVFTDDDVCPCLRWIESYARAFDAHPEMAACGGRIEPLWETPPPDWLLDYIGGQPFFGPYALMDQGPMFLMGKDVWFFGANMALRAEIFTWTGFHPEIQDGRTIGDGEAGLNEDLSRAGLSIGYAPEAAVRHRIGIERMTPEYIRRWAWHLGGSLMYRQWRGRRRKLFAALCGAWRIVREFSPAWLRAPFLKNDHSRRALDLGARAAEGWCRLAYLVWLFTDPAVRKALDMKEFSVCPPNG